MTQQQPEQLAQTDQIPLLTHGSAELLTFAHQWDFPRLDTLCSDHQEEETLQVEEADSQEEEEEEDSLAEEIQEDPFLNTETLKEDRRETA